MAPTFTICIDESGDDGFRYEDNPDCSKWLVLAAAVFPQAHRARLDSLVLDIKDQIGWKRRKPLHFIDVRGERREKLVRAVAQAGELFRSVVVMFYKPCIEEPETFRDRHRLYFYAMRFLLERASWVCRDSKASRDRSLGDGTARVVFSNLNELSRARMQEYFDRLRSTETNIDWSAIRPNQFETLSNGKLSGLQIADTVASAFYCANHHCLRSRDERWAEILKPTVFRHAGRFRGYGLKFFPLAAEKQIAQGTLAPWATRLYPV